MNAPAPIIYVVDDDVEVCKSLEWLFRSVGFQVEAFGCVADFLAGYEHVPGCLILDINLPGKGGLEFARELPRLRIDLPVIIITGRADVPTAVSAMKAGAIDFFPKPFDGTKLIEMVQSVIEEQLLHSERRRGACCGNRGIFRLTPRERDVMKLLVSGKTNKEIARILDIGVRTVETYRSEVMRKLNIKSLADLVRLVLDGQQTAG